MRIFSHAIVLLTIFPTFGQRIIHKPPTLKERVSQLELQAKALAKQVEDLLAKFEDRDQQLKLMIEKSTHNSALEVSVDATWSLGMRALEARNISLAAKHFNTIIDQYPHDPKAPYAYYWLGEVYTSQNNYYQAQLHYKVAYKQLPKSEPKALESGIKAAQCLFKGQQHQAGCDYLRMLLQAQGEQLPATEIQKLEAQLKQHKCKQ